MSRGMLPLAASVLAAGMVAGCSAGATFPVPGKAAAVAYMKSHPVPPRAGYAAGIVLSDSSDTNAPDPQPSSGWFDWGQTLVTAAGRVITIRCGSRQRTCTWRDPGPLNGTGGVGTYEYFRPSGDATSFSDVHVIKWGAVRP